MANTNKEQIDNEIFGLDYNPQEILYFDGNQYENFVEHSSNWSNDEFYVITRSLHEVSGNYDISAPNAAKDVAYPGGLLMGNNGIVEGSPQSLDAARDPINISIDLPGMESKSCVTVENPVYENVHSAVDILLNNWYTSCSDKNNIPAVFQMKSTIAEEEKQLALNLDVSVNFLKDDLGIDFGGIYSRKKSTYVTEYKQIFYTVSAGKPTRPSDVFSEDVTWDLLSKKGVSAKQPPMYVQNVQYGRQIFITFESSMTDVQLEAALDGKITLKNGIKIDGNVKLDGGYSYSDIHVKVIVLGGRSDIYSGILSDEDFIKKMNDIIFSNTKLSAENPAYPVCYLPCFLKDNKPASIVGNTEYITEEVTKYRNGNLKLRHTGAYVAKFNVTWQEYEYNDKGVMDIKNCSWPQNGEHKTAGFEANIPLNANTRNICIKAEGETGLVWDKWHNPIDKKNLAMVENREAKIWGTTLNQKGEVKPE